MFEALKNRLGISPTSQEEDERSGAEKFGYFERYIPIKNVADSVVRLGDNYYLGTYVRGYLKGRAEVITEHHAKKRGINPTVSPDEYQALSQRVSEYVQERFSNATHAFASSQPPQK
jgi:hypothetical protein